MATKLEVPYWSQKDKTTASYSINDCGPTCLSMMIGCLNKKVAPDQIYRDSGITTKGPIAVNYIKMAGNLYGLDLGRHDTSNGMGFTKLQQFLDEGRPALVLVDYFPVMRANLHQSRIGGGHFVVAVGYDDNYVYAHDPYWDADGGAYRKWPIGVWNESWFQHGTQYQKICLVPNKSICGESKPPYPIADNIARRMRAKAMWVGQPAPTPQNESDYNNMLEWLGDWGLQMQTYVVVAGDTMGQISEHFYGGADYYMVIATFNNLRNASAISVGQKLLIPIPPGVTGPTESDSSRPAAKPFTNQQVVNAFHKVFSDRGEVDKFWDYAIAGGIGHIADKRSERYSGPDILSLPNIPADALKAIDKMLRGG